MSHIKYLIRIIQKINSFSLFSEKKRLFHSLLEKFSSCDDTDESGSEMDPLETAETRMVRLSFRGRDSIEINLKADEVVTIVCKENEGYWHVQRGAV